MTKILLGIMLTCTALASPVEAETDNTSGWYIGAGAGASRLKPDTKNSGFSVSDSYDFAYEIFAGHDWSGRISTEAYYAVLGKASLSPYGEVEYEDFGISGLYYFRDRASNQQNWALFGKLGAGRMRNDSDLSYRRDNDYHVLFGAGAERRLTQHLTLRIGVDLYDEDARLVSINLLRRFPSGK